MAPMISDLCTAVNSGASWLDRQVFYLLHQLLIGLLRIHACVLVLREAEDSWHFHLLRERPLFAVPDLSSGSLFFPSSAA